MSLRGKKPEAIQKRLKALFYGAAGSGKTTAAIQFPKPYLIDCEKGAENDQYIKLLEKNEGAIFQTTQFDELLLEVKSLLTVTHEYKTLIIDPLTVIYNDLLDKAALKVGNDFGRHYNEANKQIKHLLSLLLRLDMNVIITSHSKSEYGTGMAVIGQTYDCYKKLDYLFDMVFEVQKRGDKRFAIVKKTRCDGFRDSENFEFNYEEIAKRYDKDLLEKDSSPLVLASSEQVTRLKYLLDQFRVEQTLIDKILEKGNAEIYEELKADDIQKWIASLESKITGDK